MAIILSTGLVDWLTAGGSLREFLSDCIMYKYSGTPPATADEAPGTTKLVKITKASGAVVAGTSDYSTPQKTKIVFADHDENDIYDLDVTIDGVVHNVLFTNSTASIGGHTLILIAAAAAKLINLIPGLIAISDGVDTVYVQGEIGGLAFTIADGGGTATAPTITDPVAAVRVNTLSFGPPTAGVISKTAGETWSGVNLATNVAGFFRIVLPSDSEILSTTERRIQGNILTSGSDLDMSNTTLTIGATDTVENYSLTQPKLAA